MTYFPRMYKKDGDYVVNGSVAVLSLKKDQSISTQQVAFFATDTFRNFYKIARNKGTRSLNIDNVSVFRGILYPCISNSLHAAKNF